jgi:16S rRNA A1518/A1519 N6-dimethyltransferase RsmA/KsgA/DIM1 with predicted DNA glycosylase/AP lyase activity
VTVVPKKSLGQHFLADSNILGVIDRLAALDDQDVVLEVGPGLGVLTRYLAARVAHLHAVELDRSLEPSLQEALSGHENVALRFADALAVDPATLRPSPTKLVANLPYSIATPLVVETLLGANELEHWCVMVQRSRYSLASTRSERDSTRCRGPSSARSRMSTPRSLRSGASRRRGRWLTCGTWSRERSPTAVRRSRTRSSSPASPTAR